MQEEQHMQPQDKQPEAHRKKEVTRPQYPFRMTPELNEKLTIMATHHSKNDVITRGVETEWEYYRMMQRLPKDFSVLTTAEQLEDWRVQQLKDSPELMAKYATPIAINRYTNELAQQRQLDIVQQATYDDTSRVLRGIANNINQLAKLAHQGRDISIDELSRLTHATIQLKDVFLDALKQQKVK